MNNHVHVRGAENTTRDYSGRSSAEIAEDMAYTKKEIERTFSLLARKVTGADGKNLDRAVSVSDKTARVMGFIKNHPVTTILGFWVLLGALWNLMHMDLD